MTAALAVLCVCIWGDILIVVFVVLVDGIEGSHPHKEEPEVIKSALPRQA